jgi:UDP-glucose-4-epimerase GalE
MPEKGKISLRVLVVGGAGYVGSHVVLRLHENGMTPVIYDNFSTGFRSFVDKHEIIDAGLADYSALRVALRDVEAVIHLAARAYVGESIVKPREYYETNVSDALNLLNATVDAGVKKLVFSSSCAVYGNPTRLPIDEGSPRSPLTPYGQTKVVFEDALKNYASAYGLRFVALRYFNAAGADEAGNIGEVHYPETHLIPRILQAATGRLQSVEIFGNDYGTADGTCIRDYVHVNDLANGHINALQLLLQGGDSDFINLGSGTGFSVLEIISAAEQLTCLPIQTMIRPRRPGDPPVLVADGRRARSKLHWSPERGLAEILSSAWRWQRTIQEKTLIR